MLEILLEFVAICKKHNIEYWLAYGSLLGAVRHQGFVPWDDDLDIGVLQKDYKRLLNILKKELPERFSLENEDTDENYFFKFARVVDKNSLIEDPAYKHVNLKYRGVYLDIFPLEFMPSKRWKSTIEYWYGNAFRRSRRFYKGKYMEYSGKILLPFAFILVCIMRLVVKITNPQRLFTSAGVPFCYNGEHKFTDMFPLSTVKFEGYELSAPKDPDIYLKEHYGDYMQIPPEEKRTTHSVKTIFFD
ncbi:MAG: LicD family protein [Bacteroidales bacterium]